MFFTNFKFTYNILISILQNQKLQNQFIYFFVHVFFLCAKHRKIKGEITDEQKAKIEEKKKIAMAKRKAK